MGNHIEEVARFAYGRLTPQEQEQFVKWAGAKPWECSVARVFCEAGEADLCVGMYERDGDDGIDLGRVFGPAGDFPEWNGPAAVRACLLGGAPFVMAGGHNHHSGWVATTAVARRRTLGRDEEDEDGEAVVGGEPAPEVVEISESWLLLFLPTLDDIRAAAPLLLPFADQRSGLDMGRLDGLVKWLDGRGSPEAAQEARRLASMIRHRWRRPGELVVGMVAPQS